MSPWRSRPDRSAAGELLAKFKQLIPDYQSFFDTPVSDNALWGRADTGRRGGKYAAENPDRSSHDQAVLGTGSSRTASRLRRPTLRGIAELLSKPLPEAAE